MKRDAALVGLSHDHHRGLVAARQLRRANAGDVTDARAAFLEFWHGDGERHFQVEEQVLLPRFSRRGEAGHEAVVRVLTEHVELRRRALDIERLEAPEVDLLRETGDLLDAHIRHEERVLFPLIEQTLSAEELADVAAAVAAAEREGARLAPEG